MNELPLRVPPPVCLRTVVAVIGADPGACIRRSFRRRVPGRWAHGGSAGRHVVSRWGIEGHGRTFDEAAAGWAAGAREICDERYGIARA